MTLTRIKAPKYKVKYNKRSYVLNEYELRCLMLEIAEGKKSNKDIIIKDEKGVIATIESNGRLSNNVYGMDINSRFTLGCMPYWKKQTH